MRVHVCGVRGSTPAPGSQFVRYGGHTACLAVGPRHRPPDLILDAGTGIRLVSGLLGGEAFRGSILLGHLHWDHTHGLPFFDAGDRPDSRVSVFSPLQADGTGLAQFMCPPHFPITAEDLHGSWDFATLEEGEHEIEGYRVLARPIPHKGGITFGYRLERDGRSLAYMSDHGPVALGPGPAGHGPQHPTALELATGVDLLIHDAQIMPEEWAAKGHYGHSTPDYAIELARRAGVGKLLMFHHDPVRTDRALDALRDRWRRERHLEVLTAREGQVIDVGPS